MKEEYRSPIVAPVDMGWKKLSEPIKAYKARKAAKTINKEWDSITNTLDITYLVQYPGCDIAVSEAKALSKNGKKYYALYISNYIPDVSRGASSPPCPISLDNSWLDKYEDINNELYKRMLAVYPSAIYGPNINAKLIGLTGINFFIEKKDYVIFRLKKKSFQFGKETWYYSEATKVQKDFYKWVDETRNYLLNSAKDGRYNT